MLDLLELAAGVWAFAWALVALHWITLGSRHAILFLCLVFSVFFGLPLLLDQLIGPPMHFAPGFSMATADAATRLIYCLFVIAVPPFWWWAGKGSRRIEVQPLGVLKFDRLVYHLRRLRTLLYLLVISPLLLVALAPEPEVYLTYGVAAMDTLSEGAARFHAYIALATLLSVLASTTLLLQRRVLRLTDLLPMVPWLLIPIWLNGKRFIVALVLILLLYVFWQRGVLRGARLLVAVCLGLLMTGTYSYLYQSGLRNDILQRVTPEVVYTVARLDYGRDYVTKLAIFGEVQPTSVRILEYRGQSLLFLATMYVPRSLWPEKPFTFAQYLISAAFLSPPQPWPWTFPAGVMPEMIANLSWLGLLIGPLVIALLCRLGDRPRQALVTLLTVLLCTLLLVISFTLAMPVFVLWLGLLLWLRRTRGSLALPAPAAAHLEQPAS